MTTSIKQVIKRNGKVVDFDIEKIKRAIKKAFESVSRDVDPETLSLIVDHINVHISHKYAEKNPRVESIQDIVEQVLMEKGLYPVAKAYIVYRYEHQRAREQEKKDVQEKIDKDALYIADTSGQKEIFSLDKLKQSLNFAIKGLNDVIDKDLIAQNCRAEMYDGIGTKDLENVLIMTSRALIERDPAYSKVTARLLGRKLYKEIIGDNFDPEQLQAQYQQAFIANIKKGIEIKRFDERLLEYNLEALSKKLVIDRDDLFEYLGLQVLYDRYFVKNPSTNDVLELPQAFWMRVAMGLAIDEQFQEKKALEFYEVMSNLRYIPSTPTLFHAGTCHPQLSSCYLTTVQDSLTHIFKSVADNAQLSKWSGGIGNDWTNIRGTGSQIKGTGVESQGVIPFLKIANDTTVAINRSGRRRGATCAYLETWHYDIESFLDLRKNTGDERRRTHDMNTANWIPDLFMKRVRDDKGWTLFSPDETPDLHHIYGKEFEQRYKHYEKEAEAGNIKLFKQLRAKDLWRKMVSMLFETGHPWMTWKDPSNIRSPQDHVGVIHSSNLCVEITLNTSEDEVAVCNLGSINLKNHVKNGKLDEQMVKETVLTGMRMLDNVIDINFYPTKEGKNANMQHRPVGFGIMGFQDALFLSDINFDSPEAVEFADTSMELISYYAILGSTMLAEEKGSYKTFKGSKWDRGILPVDTLDLLEQERSEKIPVSRETRLDWDAIRTRIKQFGMRNSNCLAMAPTATISNIAGAFPTIEPIYKNLYVKSNMSGEFIVVNHYLIEDLKKLNLWNQDMLNLIKQNDGDVEGIDTIPRNIKDKYQGVFDISPKQLIKVAAHRGKWIDQSQSFNMYYNGSSGKEISDMYMYAWELGLKTTYYLRTLAATHVEKSTVALTSSGDSDASVVVKEETKSTDEIPLAEAPVVADLPTGTPNLCRIEDPDCEACQ